MPRKKKEEVVVEEIPVTTSKHKKSLAERLKAGDALCAELTKSGKIIAGRVSQSEEVRDRLTMKFIETPVDELNEALGGGFVQGKMTIITGEEDSGKTSLALETAAIQMRKDPEYVVGWCESEDSLGLEQNLKMFSIDESRFFPFYQDQAQGIGAEDVVDSLISWTLRVEPDMIVINTLKMLVPKNELGKPMEKVSVAEQARFNSSFVKKFIPLCASLNITLIVIQQLTTKIGGYSYGDPLVMTGGRAIAYNSFMRVDLRRCAILDTDPIAKGQGIKIHASVRKNHAVTDRNPYVMVEYFVEYGKGVEKTLTKLKRLIDKGILIQKGAWIYLLDDNGNKQKDWSWQGKGAFKADMEANPDKLQKLVSMLDGPDSLSEEEIAEIQKEEEE